MRHVCSGQRQYCNFTRVHQHYGGENRAINIDNFNTDERFYRAGDKITLQKGFAGYCWSGNVDGTNTATEGGGMLFKECVLAEEVTYVFDGMLWMVYIPYTDLEVKSEVSVQVGASANIALCAYPAMQRKARSPIRAAMKRL